MAGPFDAACGVAQDRLVPAIHGPQTRPMQGGWVYILTNRPDGTLYVGVTGNLVQRIWQHREGIVEGFSKRYGLKMLVYYEGHDDIRTAIQRESNIKHWSRTWKVNLIHQFNPQWRDLYDDLI
jgi:putative endonuclease